mmetsp:Transcript_1173/g.2028  ORF Transcript_1173/g.2028 Transcript_1173/m.2028 type:complete len:377 (+) Transcript_1173:1123-2253(+)
MPSLDSPGSKPPTMTGRSRFISATHAAGTPSRRMRTKEAMGILSENPSKKAPTFEPSGKPEDALAGSASSPSAPSSPSSLALGFFSTTPPSPSSSSSSSAELQPPVMNFRPFSPSILSASHFVPSPGRADIRAESVPSRSPRLPSSCLLSLRPLGFKAVSSPPPSSSSSSNKSTVAWSVGFRATLTPEIPPAEDLPDLTGSRLPVDPPDPEPVPYTMSSSRGAWLKRRRAFSATPFLCASALSSSELSSSISSSSSPSLSLSSSEPSWSSSSASSAPAFDKLSSSSGSSPLRAAGPPPGGTGRRRRGPVVSGPLSGSCTLEFPISRRLGRAAAAVSSAESEFCRARTMRTASGSSLPFGFCSSPSLAVKPSFCSGT